MSKNTPESLSRHALYHDVQINRLMVQIYQELNLNPDPDLLYLKALVGAIKQHSKAWYRCKLKIVELAYGDSETIMIYFNILDAGAMAEAARAFLHYIKKKPPKGDGLDFANTVNEKWLTYDPAVQLKEPAHKLAAVVGMNLY